VRAVDQWGNNGAWSGTITGTPAQINGAVDIVADSITAGQIAANSITADELAANSVSAGKLTANSVVAANITAGAVTATAIAALSINTSHIQASAITSAEIAAGSITTAKIAAGAITADKITANSISTGQLAVGGVTAATIADLAILESKIAVGAVSGAKISAGAITADKIMANTITASEIAANAITADELSALSIISGKYIHSANYVPGSAGWAIEGDGSAEFSNVTVRGTIIGSTIRSGNGSGAYIGLEPADQDTLRFYTGGGDWSEINTTTTSLQLRSPFAQGTQVAVDLYSAGFSGSGSPLMNITSEARASYLRSTGDVQADNNVRAFGVFEGGSGSRAELRMSSGNTCHFYWDGSQAWIVIDGAASFPIS
jgi:hypothetical protein